VTQPLAFHRAKALCARTGLSRTTLWRHAEDGLLPKPVKLSGHIVAWPVHEVDAVLAARLRGANDAQIRALVAELTQARDAGKA